MRSSSAPARSIDRVAVCLAALTLAGWATWTSPIDAQPPSVTTELASAKTWLEHRQDVENYLREGKIVGMKEVPVGVTKPMRCQFEPGGLVTEMAWKPIKPGQYSGYYESYKNEIAAYELDKLLRLEMVPPTVEKRLNGELGAAVMWVSPTRNFKELGGAPTPPGRYAYSWARQLVRAKMFDNLIANIDPNLGNWLVDPAWNLMLIDHTRSFTVSKRLIHKMTRVDQDLWARMQALDEPALHTAIGQWLDTSRVRSILARRDVMREVITKLIAQSGEEAVVLR